MQSYRISLCYDGTGFAGWQFQPGQRTIQGALQAALQNVLGQPVTTIASGRTDSGVHALGQVASFSCETRLDPETIQRALNAVLPEDIGVLEVALAKPGFHAIRHAIGKRYRYVLFDGQVREVFQRNYMWQHRIPLDVAAMDRAAQLLRGRHDFASFETAGSPRPNSIRTITDIHVRRVGQGRGAIEMEVAADGFLYNMVRAIVGSLVEVGRGAQPPEWLAEVLQAKDRSLAGQTAPPQGLFLVSVQYADS